MDGIRRGRNREYGGGALVFLLGLGAMLQGRSYEVGSLTQMGPGFFPVALGVILALSGVALVGVARVSQGTAGERGLPPEWKAWGLILAGLALFVIVGRFGGLVPATFALVFVAALADRQNSARGALALALAMVVVAVVIFRWALQLPFPLFSWG